VSPSVSGRVRTGERGGAVINAVLSVVVAILCLIGLFVYGIYWPGQFAARVPQTNMRDVERAVGKPLTITTNGEGSVKWDYTRWWSEPARVYFDTNGNFVRIFTD
jgi:hypothetical protein